MTFDERIAAATDFERVVIAHIKEETEWKAEPFGQALLTEQTRANIRDIRPVTLLRWLPDIIATKCGEAKLVDAKLMGRLDTGNIDIEMKSLEAAISIETAWNIDVLFAFNQVGTISASEIQEIDRWEGTWRGDGSGTPFWLFRIPDDIKRLSDYLT